MPELLIGELLSPGVTQTTVADRHTYLTDYIQQDRYRTPNVMGERFGGDWEGGELEGVDLKHFILGRAQEISSAWSDEYQQSVGKPLDMGAFTRVSVLADKVSLNVVREALAMTRGENRIESEAAKSVLFHKYFNSAIAATIFLRVSNPYINLDPEIVLDEATTIVQDSINNVENRSVEDLSHDINNRTAQAARNHLGDQINVPALFFGGNKNYQVIKDLILEVVSKTGNMPSSDEIKAFYMEAFPDDINNNWTAEFFTRRIALETDFCAAKKRLKDVLVEESDDLGGWDVDPNTERAGVAGHLHQELKKALAGLPNRQGIVLGARVGFETGDEKSLVEIANILGLSPERVRQIDFQGRFNMKQRFRNYDPKDFDPNHFDLFGSLYNGVITAMSQQNKERVVDNLEKMEALVIEQFLRHQDRLKEDYLHVLLNNPEYVAGTNPYVDRLLQVQKLRAQAGL